MDHDENAYVESEDEDFKLEDENVSEELSGDDDDFEKEYKSNEFQEGGLIKTRYARQQESLLGKQFKVADDSGTSAVGDIWETLKQEAAQRIKINNSSEIKHSDAKVAVTKQYKFAGEVITETTYEEQPENVTKPQRECIPGLRRPKKRPPILESIIAGSFKPKLSTLEKSKLDWNQYVDKEGIREDLTLHNKDGYLEKQDFLSRVEMNKDAQYKELRKQQLAQDNKLNG